jgi:cobalt-zinc-cadmium efflux system membrane fusion protein
VSIRIVIGGTPRGTALVVPTFQLRAVALGVLAAGCSSSAASEPPNSPPPSVTRPDLTVRLDPASRPYVTTQPVALGAATPVVRAPARVSFRDGAVSQINMPVAGRVTAVHVKTGDRVKAGDPLITLASPEAAAARASSAAAFAEHEVAARELARQDSMASSGVGIDTERVAAQAKVRQSEVELARAQTTAAILGTGGGSVVVLRAPTAGTVIARHASIGSVAQPGGEPLIEIGDSTLLWVVADVFERDLAQIQEGADVDVELSTRHIPAHGKVVTIGSALTGTLRTAPVYIALDDLGPDIRAGMFARAAIKAPAGQSIVLPAEAVLIKSGKTAVVYVKTAEGSYAPHQVEVGPSIDGMVQVVSGVKLGDQVVVKGALLLDGAAEQLQ